MPIIPIFPGGSSSDVIEVVGGATMEVPESFGEAPFIIEVDDDEAGALAAQQVTFNNAGNGMDSTDVQGAIEELKSSIENKDSNVQADWNQNDPDAPDYVKNKTHWTETTLITNIDNETLAFPSEETDINWVELSIRPFPVCDYSAIVAGNPPLYRVIWDGVEYEGYLYEAGEGIHLGGFDEGYPFQVSGPDYCYIYAYDESGNYDYGSTHTITVSAVGEETVHKLDQKYLPDFASVIIREW